MANKVYGTIDLEARTAVTTRAVQSPMIPPKVEASKRGEENTGMGFWETAYEGALDVLKIPVTVAKTGWGAVEKVGSTVETITYVTIAAVALVAIVVLPKIFNVDVKL